MAGICASFLVR